MSFALVVQKSHGPRAETQTSFAACTAAAWAMVEVPELGPIT